ncbi:MAG: hypothetical protein ABW171_05535 [Steroidobacter sp.]
MRWPYTPCSLRPIPHPTRRISLTHNAATSKTLPPKAWATNTGSYLVKWLDREIRFARKNSSVCTTAGLTLPSGMVLPTSADLKNPSNANSDVFIGTKPTVTEAPRVIHGDVMF